MTNGHYVIPKLVEDASLKRARTEVEIDGEKQDVIRVLPAGGAGLDARGVADAMGLELTTVAANSVLGYLQYNETMDMNTHETSMNTAVIKNDAHAAAEVLGTASDPAVTSGNSGSINSRLRYVSAGLDDIGYATVNINTNTGTSASAAWTGTGNGTLISIGKRTSNDTNATATATGTQSDAAWSGSGNATIIALLKGIYNKL